MSRRIEEKTSSGKSLRTICEVHREIYDIIHATENNELKDLLNEAYVMAKKMDAKLRQYKNNYDDGWWEKEKDQVVKEKIEKRILRQS